MKIGQYCQRQRCKHVELEQFWHAFASRGFVSDSWAFLLGFNLQMSHRKLRPTRMWKYETLKTSPMSKD